MDFLRLLEFLVRPINRNDKHENYLYITQASFIQTSLSQTSLPGCILGNEEFIHQSGLLCCVKLIH